MVEVEAAVEVRAVTADPGCNSSNCTSDTQCSSGTTIPWYCNTYPCNNPKYTYKACGPSQTGPM